MEFTCLSSKILEILQNANEFIEIKDGFSITSNIKLKLENKSLYISATNANSFYESSITIDSDLNLNTTVNSNKFLSILKTLSDEELNFNFENNVMKIKNEKNNYIIEFRTLSADTFPSIDIPPINKFFDIPKLEFRNLLEKTKICTAVNDINKPILNGINIKFKKEADKYFMICAATNSKHLAYYKTELKNKNLKETEFTLPISFIEKFLKVSGTFEENMKIYVTDDRFFIKLGNTYLSSVLLKGNYVNYEVLFNDTYDSEVVVDINSLRKSIERVNVLNDKDSTVLIKIIDDNMIISNFNSDIGYFEQKINLEKCSLKKNEFSVILKFESLISYLKEIKEGNIKIYLNTEKEYKPVKITPENNLNLLYLTSPISKVS